MVVAGSVDEAISMLERVHPTLIVSNICMPESDGYDLIRRVRAKRDGRATPAVALSARRRALRSGAASAAARPSSSGGPCVRCLAALRCGGQSPIGGDRLRRRSRPSCCVPWVSWDHVKTSRETQLRTTTQSLSLPKKQ